MDMLRQQQQQLSNIVDLLHKKQRTHEQQQEKYESQIAALNDVLSGFCNRIENLSKEVAKLTSEKNAGQDATPFNEPQRQTHLQQHQS